MPDRILPLSNTQAKGLAGKLWRFNGQTYYFKDYDPASPGQPPWRSGAEGKAFPLLHAGGQVAAYLKFFTTASPVRLDRTLWLVAQQIHSWAPQLCAAPSAWVDSREHGQPDGVGFHVTGCLATAARGETWLEVKYRLCEDRARLGKDLRWQCLCDLVAALAVLERAGIVHGDLSPGNILVNVHPAAAAPALAVIDFDAFVAQVGGRRLALTTGEGGTYGTEGYCPPDLVQKAQSGDLTVAPYSDRHSRDMLLLELLLAGPEFPPEAPPRDWPSAKLERRYGTFLATLPANAAPAVQYLQPPGVFFLPERLRPTSQVLAKALALPLPAPQLKSTPVGQPAPAPSPKAAPRRTLRPSAAPQPVRAPAPAPARPTGRPLLWAALAAAGLSWWAVLGGGVGWLGFAPAVAGLFLAWGARRRAPSRAFRFAAAAALVLSLTAAGTQVVGLWVREAGDKARLAETTAKAEFEAKAKAAALASVSAFPGLLVGGQHWTNTLGMVFTGVPGAPAFSIWDTRVQDYQAFANATGRSWGKPSFEQGPTHPAVNVSWNDAQAFCQWLTQKEKGEGKLAANQSYRLPSDAEWSVAVGLPAEPGATPRDKDGKNTDLFPWGTGWPPPKGAGNYVPSLSVDSFAFTSPVGSFAANQFGLYDLGGNVWQWCSDEYYSGSGTRVLRGASWYDGDRVALLSSYRSGDDPDGRDGGVGFRVVVAGGAPDKAHPAETTPKAEAQAPARAAALVSAFPGLPAGQQYWTNTLGMVFAGVPGAPAFSIWDTRVQDYQAFANATGRSWEKSAFEQGPTHPAVNVSWNDAQAFCQWLTQKEKGEGKLAANQSYRLPSDAEWSVAVGLPAEPGATPRDKDGKNTDLFPWGTGWPPPKGAGNYDSSLNVDSFAYTSPVGSFAANQFGLYDLGGNVWQWCNDEYYSGSGTRVLRGASWLVGGRGFLLSSDRRGFAPGRRRGYLGFRVVVAGGSAP